MNEPGSCGWSTREEILRGCGGREGEREGGRERGRDGWMNRKEGWRREGRKNEGGKQEERGGGGGGGEEETGEGSSIATRASTNTQTGTLVLPPSPSAGGHG